jgi:hypothetical protein
VDRAKLELFILGSQKVKVGTRELVSGILILYPLCVLFTPAITTFFFVFSGMNTVHDKAEAVWCGLGLLLH